MPTETKTWTPDQLQFQLWLALPSKLRRPRQQRQLAELIGVHESTLSDWKKLAGWREAVGDLAVQLIKDDVPEVIGTLRKLAKEGSYPHLKMFLEMAGLYMEHRDITSAGEKLKAYIGFTPDEWDGGGE